MNLNIIIMLNVATDMVEWNSSRTSVFGRQTYPVLCSTDT